MRKRRNQRLQSTTPDSANSLPFATLARVLTDSQSQRSGSALTLLSVLYLALPYGLFAVGWLWWPYAVALCGVLLGGLVAVGRATYPTENGEFTTPQGPRWVNLALILLATLALMRVAGVGGVGFQMYDWLKHNSVLHDLAVDDWPVRYGASPKVPQGAYLTYYIAYYLPAAAVGKVLGVSAAHWALLVWTLMGLLLCAAWLGRLLRSRLWLFWVGWFLLGGLDAVGVSLRGGGYRCYMEWWADLGQLSSNMSLLAWVPQHMLPGWIATGLIMDRAERTGDLSLTGMVAALTSLWSPFVTIGLAPLAVVLLLRGNRRSAWSLPNLVVAPLILVLSATYLASIKAGGVPSGWTWRFFESSWFIKYYLAFLFLEFGIYAILLALHLRRGEKETLPAGSWNHAWLGMAVIFLSVLPLYRIGLFYDLTMRGSIPALFVFWIVLLRVLSSRLFRLETWASSLLVFCLFLGTIQPLFQLGTHVIATQNAIVFITGSSNVTIPNLEEKFLPQYSGRHDAFFFQRIARQSPVIASPPTAARSIPVSSPQGR